MDHLQIVLKQELETDADTQEAVLIPENDEESPVCKTSPEQYPSIEQDYLDWIPHRPEMTSPKHQFSDEEDEGIISSPSSPQKEEVDRFSDPIRLDFKSWKEKVGSLIQSENHVMMHTDDELREAISQAMFLETASENLLSKRKQQLEIIDKCRVEEGASAKKLYEENIEILQKSLGPNFGSFANDMAFTLEKASRPLNAPDLSRPPPLMPMPPLNIPPPGCPIRSDPPKYVSASSSTTSVTNEMAKTLITPTPRPPVQLMSQHLLPPPLFGNPDASRSGFEKNILHENDEQHQREHESVNDGSRHGFLSTSWRTPYHPIPVPPPKKYPFTPHIPLPPLPRRSPLADRRNFGRIKLRGPPPLPSTRSSEGFVGINVRGVFVGDRHHHYPVSPFESSPNTSDGFQ